MKKIVIVGGGTSGWLTAAYLSAKLDSQLNSELDITLIEASDIPTIGVGEATTPSLRSTLAELGVDEFKFMRACNATFKHGIVFDNWTKNPKDEPDDSYFHPFERPLRAGTEGLESYWLRGMDPYKRNFEDATGIQNALARSNLAPKSINDKPYSSPIPYAYHLDACLLAEALKQLSKDRGIHHTVDKVTEVNSSENGEISSLTMESGAIIEGDFFIDCSGFSALLIEKHFKEPLIDCSDVLFCDSAITYQIPNKAGQVVPPYTRSSAKENGWIWDIGLSNRRGTGYVYSSKYTTQEEAEKVLRDYLGTDADPETPMRKLEFPCGHRKNQWIKNCVSIGLSSGFIEPLESTGIHLVEQSVWALASLLPRFFSGSSPQKQYNGIMENHYDMAINFVKYHYILTQRTDSQFWIDNANPDTWTDWLREKVDMWKTSYPDVYDIEKLHTIFDHASYQYVFFGMAGRPELHSIRGQKDKFALKVFEQVNKGLKNARNALPTHNDLLNKIHNKNTEKVKMEEVENFSTINDNLVNIPNNYSVR
jgi:tryptophan halogenase